MTRIELARSGLAPLAARQLLAFLVLWGTLAAWWYPAPLLVEMREVDWAERYRRAYAPTTRSPLFGAMEMAREAIRDSRPILSMTRFIDAETEGSVLPVQGTAWEGMLERMRSAEPGAGLILRASDPQLQEPLQQVNEETRFALLAGAAGPVFLELRRLRPDDYGFGQAPAAERFPLRSQWAWLVVVGLLAVGAIRLRPAGQSRLAGSMVGTGLKWSFGLLSAGLVLALYPAFSQLGMDGIGLTFMGGMVTLFGLIALSVTGWHALAIARILDGRDLLAHWIYDPGQWQRFAREDLEQRREMSKGLLWMVVAIAILVVAIFVFAAEDTKAALIAALVVAAAVVLAAAAAWGGHRAMRRRYADPHPELFLGRGGLWLNGITHVWRGFFARLEGATIDHRGDAELLCIRYSTMQSSGPRSLYFYRRYETVCVPVPKGRLQEARGVVKQLTGKRSERP